MDDTPTGPAPRVLVVRNDDAERLALELTLQDAGFQTVGAANREQALARAEDGIELILLDCQDSPIDGVECMQYFAEAFPGIPGFVIAETDRDAAADPAIGAAALGRIRAPVEPAEIIAHIEKALHGRREPSPPPAIDPNMLIRELAEASVPLAEVSQRLIKATLEITGGNRAAAARRLGVSERTIYNKVKRFGAQPS
ncbi:MAG: helix-turn-helix domain-containing protein [Planctomycetota bacterium]